jgi:hypothetical protein
MTVSPALGRGGEGKNRSVWRGEGGGDILKGGLDEEKATRRELKDCCFPGSVADTGVTQKIRNDPERERGRDVFG